ncbi:MAG: hypothetical protein U5L76_05825 [Patescibacteria group bacterium]|nr:hypothetical protein [Patescibacteria group bacterium]
MKARLKRVMYEGAIPRANGYVDYVILAEKCTFTGLSETPTSTINAAGKIILSICREEELEPDNLEFFDLQTAKGYGSKKLGEFVYDQVKFIYHAGRPPLVKKDGAEIITGGQVVDIYWCPTLCPEEVIRLFTEHIGPNPRQIEYQPR